MTDSKNYLPREAIIEKIHPNNYHRIPDQVLVKEVEPLHLLFHPKRFDVILKYIYAKFWLLGINSDWYKDLYTDHLRIIAPDFIEGDGTEKKGLNSFLLSFHQLLNSLSKSGFDPDISIIPVNKEGVIIDGAHRLAACAALDKNITIACPVDYDKHDYSFSWFLNRGFPRKWADYAALEYCQLNQDSYIALVWPKAIGKDDEIRAILNSIGRIYYEKTAYLENNGPINLMKIVYADAPWIGNWNDGYSGAASAAYNYFNGKSGALRIFVFESQSSDQVLRAKSEIRTIFGIGNYSIHINDSHEETITISQNILNDNTIHYLNHANIRETSSLLTLLPVFSRALSEHHSPYDHFCIDSSMVLAAYGIREARDLDLLHHGYDTLISSLHNLKIGSHNEEIPNNFFYSADSIIYNPENHFYINHIKFVKPDIVRLFKGMRGEDKDLQDLVLMNRFFGIRHRILILIITVILSLKNIIPPKIVQFITKIPIMDKMVLLCMKR